MITRAQAEALLTLAEALEACERRGVTLEAVSGINLEVPGLDRPLWGGRARDLRERINSLIPKHTGS
jgi:hypothetical protein